MHFLVCRLFIANIPLLVSIWFDLFYSAEFFPAVILFDSIRNMNIAMKIFESRIFIFLLFLSNISAKLFFRFFSCFSFYYVSLFYLFYQQPG